MTSIGIIGLGFVGLTHAVVYSSRGYKVVGIDIDHNKIELLKGGLSPVREPGVSTLLKEGLKSESLIFDTDYNRLLEENVEIVFVTVNTPTRKNIQDLESLLSAIKSLGEVFRKSSNEFALAVKSTILPGVSRRYIIPLLEDTLGRKIRLYVFNPEFLREGRAIEDILNPDRVVIGEYNRESGDYFSKFFIEFYGSGHPPIIRTSLETAELSKYASNLFLACKLSFINAISFICESVGNCDIMDVKKIIGLDERIGSQYLHPGIGFGGSCLPKDLKAFIGFIKGQKPYVDFFRDINRINSKQVKLPVMKALELFGDLQDKNISILGLSYKGGVDDVRGSRSIDLVKEFLEKGAIVKVYDPVSNESFKEFIKRFNWYRSNSQRLMMCNSIEESIKDSDMIIIATDWEEFERIDPEDIKRLARNKIIYDGRRILDPYRFLIAGVKYYGIGFARD